MSMFLRFIARKQTWTSLGRPLSVAATGYRVDRPEWKAKAAAVGAVAAAAATALAMNSSVLEDSDSSTQSYIHQSPPNKAVVSLCESAIESKNSPFRLKQVYEIEQVLGEGAYGMVYQARRKADGIVVALKTMPREYTGKTDFEREVAALQLLSKPPGNNHVVQLYDLHRDDKNYYLAMELIEGGELFDHLIENGPYSEAVAASFLRQFAEGICFVHSIGLTHADLKPENLMISSNDVEEAQLKVVDFGCATNHDLSRKEMQLPAQEFAMGCSFLHQVALNKQDELRKMLTNKPDLVNFRDYDRRTPLHIAASEGHLEIVQYLVEKGARINRGDRWGGYPLDDAHRHGHTSVVNFLQLHGARFGNTSRATNLITAASQGDKEQVKALLNFGNIDLNQGDYDRRTALHLAAGEGWLEIVKLLCKAGADVNVEDRWGNRPLDDAKRSKDSKAIVKLLETYGAQSLQASTGLQNAATMQDLKDQSVKLETPKDNHEDLGMTNLPAQEFAMGCSVLHQAALGNQFELEKILQEWPDLVNFRDYDRRTALHIAASEGHVDICRYLVERGAIINRSDRWGRSPLDDAHDHGHSSVVEFLRQRGARFGSTSQLNNFITAASEGDTEEVKALLEFGSIDINQGDYDRRTALHLAAGEGRLEIVELLCQAGADVNVEDRWGNRPIDDVKSAKKYSTEIAHMLIKHGAKPTVLATMDQQSATVNGTDCQVAEHNVTPKTQQDDYLPPGTTAYCPPELFVKGATSTPAADMWATGVIMFLLLTGSHPFDKYCDQTDDQVKATLISVGPNNEDHMKLMDELVFDERIEGLSDACVQLLRSLMQPDPDKRISSDDFLRNPWIQGLSASWKTIEKSRNEVKAFWQEKFRTDILKKFSTATSQDEALAESDFAKIFRALDLKGDGVLELEEVKTTFLDLGMAEGNVGTMFACLDLDGTGVIHWEEFLTLMTARVHEGPGLQVSYLQQRFKNHILKSFAGSNADATSLDRSKLREIFNAIDLEGNGVLYPNEIRVVLRSAGVTEDVISRIVASVDLDKDGGVSWGEFLTIMGMNDT